MKLYTAKYSQTVGGTTGYAGFRNRRRLQLLTSLIPITPQSRVLEIGPNNCLLLDAFKVKAKTVLGIDINEDAVKKTDRPDLVCMDAAAMTFASSQFDAVIGIEVFEHITNLQQVFGEIRGVVVQGGKCYMTVPFELFRGMQALGDAWQVYGNLAMCRQLHVHKLNPRKIQKMIAPTGLRLVASRLIWIPGPSYFIVLQKI